MSTTVKITQERRGSRSVAREDDSIEVPKRASYFKYAPLDHAVSGLGAGFTTTAILHPLDLIKTRLQG
ncbi:hypothetical protein SARC_15463, partial [Sphaeroforma arctica JP610]